MTYPVFSDTHKHVNVFPYSIFYVFYEQYLTMVEDTAFSLAISLSSVFVVTFVLGGFDIKTAIVTTFTIILILVSILPKYLLSRGICQKIELLYLRSGAKNLSKFG